jgi:hypothetical protein
MIFRKGCGQHVRIGDAGTDLDSGDRSGDFWPEKSTRYRQSPRQDDSGISQPLPNGEADKTEPAKKELPPAEKDKDTGSSEIGGSTGAEPEKENSGCAEMTLSPSQRIAPVGSLWRSWAIVIGTLGAYFYVDELMRL